jgi:cytochrome c biogenesis protein CcdA
MSGRRDFWLKAGVMRRKTFFRLFLRCAFLAGLVLPVSGYAVLVFDPPEWNLGDVGHNRTAETRLAIRNAGGSTVDIALSAACDCLRPASAKWNIPAGGEIRAVLRFDPSAEVPGSVEKYFVVDAGNGASPVYYRVRGRIVPGGSERAAVFGNAGSVSAGSTAGTVALRFYYTPGCGQCERFLSETLPAMEREASHAVRVERKDVFNAGIYEEYRAELRARGLEAKALPALIYGGTALQGMDEIRAGIRRILSNGVVPAAPSRRVARGPENGNLLLLPVIAAGLLDGINPCAFTTLVLLLSYLALAGRSRGEILLMGLIFTASVFVTYYLIGLGFFRALRAAKTLPWANFAIKWSFAAVLAVFAGISVYDYLLVRKGRAKDMVLQLPKAIRDRLRQSVRTYARSTALASSAAVLGFLVSVFELACTGQIYFPTIAYYLQVEKRFSLYFFLGVYNLSFILPLVLVFVLVFAGVSSKKLADAFRKRLGAVKLATAVFFALLAAAVVLLK